MNGNQQEFQFEGRRAVVVLPEKPCGKWMLKTEYFGAFPEMEYDFVRRGYALAFVANGDRWGADADLDVKARFCDYMAETYGLDKQCTCIGMSCGGLIAIKFAAKHPDCVRAVYLDAPVVNLLSCPCGFGKGTDLSPSNIGIAINYLGLGDISGMLAYRDHPLDNLPKLIANRIPCALVCGDADVTVVYKENGLLVKQAYESSDVPFWFLLKPGMGHHPHGPGAEKFDEVFAFLDRF